MPRIYKERVIRGRIANPDEKDEVYENRFWGIERTVNENSKWIFSILDYKFIYTYSKPTTFYVSFVGIYKTCPFSYKAFKNKPESEQGELLIKVSNNGSWNIEVCKTLNYDETIYKFDSNDDASLNELHTGI